MRCLHDVFVHFVHNSEDCFSISSGYAIVFPLCGPLQAREKLVAAPAAKLWISTLITLIS
jgi:hypothetical protein